jgi:hypothetical protein
MDQGEIRDSLAREFLLQTVKNEVGNCDDVEKLRECVVELVDAMEAQKAIFKQMITDILPT